MCRLYDPDTQGQQCRGRNVTADEVIFAALASRGHHGRTGGTEFAVEQIPTNTSVSNCIVRIRERCTHLMLKLMRNKSSLGLRSITTVVLVFRLMKEVNSCTRWLGSAGAVMAASTTYVAIRVLLMPSMTDDCTWSLGSQSVYCRGHVGRMGKWRAASA